MTLRSPLLSATLLASALALALPVAASGANARPVQAAPASAAATAFAAEAAAAPRYRAGELVVRYGGGAHASSVGAVPRTKVVRVRDVASAERALRKRPGVLSVTRNYVAHISGWVPSDPGHTA